MVKTRAKKLLLNVVDDRFDGNNQFSILTLLTDGTSIYQNDYAKVFTQDEIGSFDVIVDPTDNSARLEFFPIDGRINDYAYSFISYDTKQDIYTNGGFNFGTIVSVATTNVLVSSGTTQTISGFSSDYTSAKYIIEMTDENNEYHEYTEINAINYANNIFTNEYAKISVDKENYPLGIGTYDIISVGSDAELQFTSPFSDRDVRCNVIQVSFGNTSFTESGFRQFRHGEVEATLTSIAATTTPVSNVVSSYTSNYNSAYFIVQVTDTTNNNVKITEIVVVNNDSEAYISEYGTLSTYGGSLGDFEVLASSVTELLFTPLPNIDTEVIVYKHGCTIAEYSTFPYGINFDNSELTTGVSRFGYGNANNYRVNFDLKHQGIDIFKRRINSESDLIVDLEEDTLYVPNHFFVTGEKIIYQTEDFLNISENAISIASTSISGIGLTDKLFGELFVYKVDESRIKLCTTAEQALSENPNFIDFTNLGIGKTHFVKATDQNNKCLITIDNVVQSPIISTGVTAILRNSINLVTTTLDFSGISSFFSGDLIEIDSEIMQITAVGVGSTAFVEVKRPWMGSISNTHNSGTLITKLSGNYNIVDNEIYFASPPYGPIQRPPEYLFSESSIPEYEIRSTFHGRVFIRSGVPLASTDTYSSNYIFDSLSNSFNAQDKDFELTSSGSSISGISTQNSILLINNILQIPEEDFNLSESLGKTYVNFTGTATSAIYDPNNASVPRGGIIVSVGSSNGFGLQPLVSAGGTAIVSISGTIQSVSIGNSGSGYRSGIQTNIRVGVQTYSSGVPNIEFIGTATVLNGNIVSINITNPGSGYTNSNPPKVVFDNPLAYSNIPLKYSSSSQAGVGTESKIDVVVGQGSSVIDFTITNYGYGFKENDILTFDVGGTTGIPLDATKSFEEFSLIVTRVYNDNFSSWNIGNLQKLDDISGLFNGTKKTFPLISNGNRFSIIKKPGSIIDLKATLIISINDVIQVPDVAYIFDGGSTITFTEPPKQGDSCAILFYTGTENIDTVNVDILETIKVGDKVKIYSEQNNLEQKERLVHEILTPDTLESNPYYSVGISQNEELLRPLNWCKQRSDLIIDNVNITKDRIEYEPTINPVAKITKSVGIGSTQIWVDSVKTLFDYDKENAAITYTNKIQIIDTKNYIGASATAIVSAAGSITAISINDGGLNYSQNPSVSIANPYYMSSGQRADANAFVTSGIVTSIIISNAGFGYTDSNPPLVLVDSPNLVTEEYNNVSYFGDFGIISGITQTSVPYATNGLVFDLIIPENSILRNPNFVDSVVGSSEIAQDYYFVVYGSTIGNGLTSLARDGSVIGIGTTGIDNVYQVISVSTGTTDAFGIGSTSVTKVVVSVSNYSGLSGFGFSSFYGNYSWGLITLNTPTLKSFEINNNYGVVGLNTTPVVKRINPLKYTQYSS